MSCAIKISAVLNVHQSDKCADRFYKHVYFVQMTHRATFCSVYFKWLVYSDKQLNLMFKSVPKHKYDI